MHDGLHHVALDEVEIRVRAKVSPCSRITSSGVKCSAASSFACSAPIRLSSSKTWAHLHVIDALGPAVDGHEGLDDLEQQVPMVHPRELCSSKREALQDLEYPWR